MIIADTHALIWWITDAPQLSATARRTLTAEEVVGISAMTCWEVATLSERRRIAIDTDALDWLRSVTALPQVLLLPLTVAIAVTAAKLRDPIRDPADRIIVATALHHGVSLVTKDARITAANVVPTIW